ncbi:MAG: hypothetical protein CBC12_07380 [Candidatus Puniceispirillum sp. TMED52]|jgi:hypothetical protein|nr:MAG: hypothetical protein CBC12_07380 [Candidatus Puniceispirillum sp. TMED52]
MLGRISERPIRRPRINVITSEPSPVVVVDTRPLRLTFAFISFRDSLSIPFLYLLIHYFINVNTDPHDCPYEHPIFGTLLFMQLVAVCAKRVNMFFSDLNDRAWRYAEVLYALLLYPWGTTMFILAKPSFYDGSVTNNVECTLYRHPMAQIMWIVSEITCSGSGLGLLLLVSSLAWTTNRLYLIPIVIVQVAVAIGWFALTVNVVAPAATEMLA